MVWPLLRIWHSPLTIPGLGTTLFLQSLLSLSFPYGSYPAKMGPRRFKLESSQDSSCLDLLLIDIVYIIQIWAFGSSILLLRLPGVVHIGKTGEHVGIWELLKMPLSLLLLTLLDKIWVWVGYDWKMMRLQIFEWTHWLCRDAMRTPTLAPKNRTQ